MSGFDGPHAGRDRGRRSRALSFKHEAFYASLERALTVELIATFDLVTCDIRDRLVDVLARSDVAEFDFLPVRHDRRVVGILNLASARQKRTLDAQTTVEQSIEAHDTRLWITAESGLLSYIETDGGSPCRLVLRGKEAEGIVTRADLQKVPVQVARY